jgi:hypothetical protein
MEKEAGSLCLVRWSLKLRPSYAAYGVDFDATIKKMSTRRKQEMTE